MLAQALVLLDQDLHHCGHPLSRSAHPEMDGAFEVDSETVCYACAAVDRWQKEHKDQAPGTIVRAVDVDPGRVLEAWDPDGVTGARGPGSGW